MNATGDAGDRARKNAICERATSEAVALSVLNVTVAKDYGDYFQCACPMPGHEDNKPSFLIYKHGGGFICKSEDCGAKGGDGVTLYALARGLDEKGRDFPRILDDLAGAFGIGLATSNGSGNPRPHKAPRPRRKVATYEHWPALPEGTKGPKSKPGRTVYQLRNVAGELLGFHVFDIGKDGKKQPWWTLGKHPDAQLECTGLNPSAKKDGVYKLCAADRKLYGPQRRLVSAPLWGSEKLPEWTGCPKVLGEGERDASALQDLGLCALGSVGGESSTHLPGSLEALAGKLVILWPDYSPGGFAHMENMGAALEEAGATVRIIDPEWLAQTPASPKAKNPDDFDGRGGADWKAGLSDGIGRDEVAELLNNAPTLTLAEFKQAAAAHVAKVLGRPSEGAPDRTAEDDTGRSGAQDEGEAVDVDEILGHWHRSPFIWASEIDGGEECVAPVVPFLAWPGRITLMCAREKLGAKTTIASQGAAAASRGDRFGNIPTQPGIVLVLTEEPPETVKYRLSVQGADLSRIAVATIRDLTADGLRRGLKAQGAALAAAVAEISPVLVVVDTLARFAAGLVAKASESDSWGPLFLPLEECARGTGCAVLVLAHARKSDGLARDSTAITAAADVLIQTGSVNSTTGRTESFTVTARSGVQAYDFAIEDFDKSTESYTIRALDGTAEQREAAKIRKAKREAEATVKDYVYANPGKNVRWILDQVKGKSATINGALKTLESHGELKAVKEGRSTCYYPPELEP